MLSWQTWKSETFWLIQSCQECLGYEQYAWGQGGSCWITWTWLLHFHGRSYNRTGPPSPGGAIKSQLTFADGSALLCSQSDRRRRPARPPLSSNRMLCHLISVISVVTGTRPVFVPEGVFRSSAPCLSLLARGRAGKCDQDTYTQAKAGPDWTHLKNTRSPLQRHRFNWISEHQNEILPKRWDI